MKNKQPFFSIIISTHNRQQFLYKAIKSVLLQTEKDWELIISDDGGEQEILQEINQIIKQNQNILYFKHAHVGLPESKNLAIEKTSGKFITFLDDDDEYLPQHLALRREVLEKNPKIEFLHGGVKIIGEEYVPDKFHPGELIHINNIALGGTFVVKRKLFNQVGGFPDEAYGNDTSFFQNVVKNRTQILKVDFPTYVYHRHQDSITMRYKNNASL